MLKIEGLSKQFANFAAVDDFRLHVAEGEFVTLLGPSGSGKTTVLRMVAGLVSPTSGSIFIGGQDVTNLVPQKRGIGLVFQSYALFPNMSAAENIAFPLNVRKWDKKRINKRVNELLEMVNLTHRASFSPDRLSGGERQRVALARALSFHPPLLLLDEPLSALDAKVRHSLRESLKEIQRSTGVTTLMVTHDQAEALELSDRVVVMSQGRIEQVGSPLDVYYSPSSSFTASFIGDINVLQTAVLGDVPSRDSMRLAMLSWHGHTFQWLMPEGALHRGPHFELRVRPESIVLEDALSAGTLAGIVQSISFMGAISRLHVQIGADKIMVDTLSSTAPNLQKGDRVGLRIMDRRIFGPLAADGKSEGKTVSSL